MTSEQYANAIQNDLHDGQSLNEEYLALVKWVNRISSENFNAGMKRAMQIIEPQNPLAQSPGTEIRNRCREEIRKELHQ